MAATTNAKNETINLIDLLDLLRKKWYLLVIFPVVLGVACAAYCWGVMEDVYTSEVQLYVLVSEDAYGSNSTSSSDEEDRLSLGEQVAADVAAMVDFDAVRDEIASEYGQKVLEAYEVSAAADEDGITRIVTITVTGKDPQRVADLADAYAKAVVENAADVISTQLQSVTVAKAATVPIEPSGPDRVKLTLEAVLAGLVFAAVLIFLVDSLSRRVRTPEEAEEVLGVPVVGEWPALKELGKKKRRNKKGERRDLFLEELQNPSSALLASIRFATLDSPARSVLVTSAEPSDGKTMVTLNLAHAMASSGKRVLLVDADMYRSDIRSVVGVSAGPGLCAVAGGYARLGDVVQPTVTENLFFMEVENDVPNLQAILFSKKFAAILERLEQSFDYVLFDSAPVGVAVGTSVMAQLADATVFVVRQRSTNRKSAKKAIADLRAAGATIVGSVVTWCDQRDSYYYDYYYYDEKGTRRKKKKEASQASDIEGSYSNEFQAGFGENGPVGDMIDAEMDLSGLEDLRRENESPDEQLPAAAGSGGSDDNYIPRGKHAL